MTDTKRYTVEDLNPRSKPVKDLEMCLRRALALSRLCDAHLRLCDDNARTAWEESPLQFGSMDKKLYKTENIQKLVKEVYGSLTEAYAQRHNWPYHFDKWYTGKLDMQIQALASCLPEKIRSKYDRN